jgi:hypothetical protein
MRKSIYNFTDRNTNTPKAIKPIDGTQRYQCSRAILMKIAKENNAIIHISGTRSVWLDTEKMDKVFSAEN